MIISRFADGANVFNGQPHNVSTGPVYYFLV